MTENQDRQHWNTEHILSTLSTSLPDDFEARKYSGPGGDVDTDWIIVERESDNMRCYIFGTRLDYPEGMSQNGHDYDIDNLHVVKYPREGISDATMQQLLFIATVGLALEKAGFEVTTDGTDAFF